MNISSGSNPYLESLVSNSASTAKIDRLENKLSNLDNASDKELLDACKNFESYFVEQVIDRMRSTLVPEDEKQNEYKEYFGDMLYKEYAEQITESGQLGIAQMLYESMKRN